MNFFFMMIGVFWLNDAYAYIDPGTGSMIFQSTIAAVVTGFFIVKNYWRKIISRIFSKYKIKKEEVSDSK